MISKQAEVAAVEPRPAQASHATRRRWLRRGALALALAAYFTLWIISAFDKLNPTDLDIFFLPAAKIALAGHPLEVYTLRVGPLYPNANGPLSLAPLTLAAWLAQARGWLGDPVWRRAVVLAVCAPFPLLAGWEALKAVERFGPPLRGWARISSTLPMLLTPLLWLDALYYGHIEQTIVVWLALAAIRMLGDARYLRGGALLGLALLARSDASLIALALLLTLVVYRRWHGALLTTLAMVGVLALGLAPFLLADARDVIFSLFTFRAALQVGGGDLWSLSNTPIVVAIAQHFDATITLAIAALFILIAHAARSDLDLDIPDIYGLVALASFCFALLIKTLWPYYFLESALFATVWALASLPRAGLTQTNGRAWTVWWLRWLAPLSVTACGVMAEYGLEATNYAGWTSPWTQVNIICELVALTLLLAALLGGAWARAYITRGDAPAGGGILTESAAEPAIEG